MTRGTLVRAFNNKVNDPDKTFMSVYFKLNHYTNPCGNILKYWRFDSVLNYQSWCVETTGRVYCVIAVQSMFSKN